MSQHRIPTSAVPTSAVPTSAAPTSAQRSPRRACAGTAAVAASVLVAVAVSGCAAGPGPRAGGVGQGAPAGARPAIAQPAGVPVRLVAAPGASAAREADVAGLGWEVTAAFLSPQAAGRAELPGWSVTDAPAVPGPLLDPCRSRWFPGQQDVLASAERQMTSQREAGGSALRQEVFRYRTARAAAAALRQYVQDVQRCPRGSVTGPPQGDAVQLSVVEDVPGRSALVRSRYCNPSCNDLFVEYYLLVRAADGLSALEYEVGEDGDPADGARALLRAAERRLRTAAGA